MGKNKEIPVFSKPIIETHCHLDYLKNGSVEEIIEKASQHNISKIMTISVEPGNLDTVLNLAKTHEIVFGTQGIHPHQAKLYDQQAKEKIKENLKHPKIVAVGEIGLDYHYNKSPRKQQLLAFEEQLEIACEENYPVVIHSRDADQDTIEILEKFAPSLEKKGVIHSFTSGLELAEKAIDLGFHLGFNGIITFKNADNVREALKLCPLEKLLLETDSPFLTPVPYRGKENAPYFLPFVAEFMSDFLEVEIDELLERIHLNSTKLFNL